MESSPMRNAERAALAALKNIPAKPSDFEVDFIYGAEPIPAHFPKGIPRHAKGVCCSSNTWGPASSSDDVFVVSTNRLHSHWILWHGYFDDNEYMRWIFQPVAACKRRGVSVRAAAFYMFVFLIARSRCFDNILFNVTGGLLTSDEVDLACRMAKASQN